MVTDQTNKPRPFLLMKSPVQLKWQFVTSVLIGIIYAFIISTESTGGFINNILPSGHGPDLHQYLPVVVPVLIYSYFIQEKRKSFLKKIAYSCLHISIAIVSFITSLILLLMF
ncbi:hypothetical protein [Paenibacillus camerounensis]|uniref:hypothetical protein n=1 Tax=Paenibacillus camerounensis TaxID=1243663 RepID=UPI0005A81AE8|nr:hypothetical protein [Paenibacillus camerounensis]